MWSADAEYDRECSPIDSDLRFWRAMELSRDDVEHMMVHHAYCPWSVVRGPAGPRAQVRFPARQAVALPFVPTWKPCRQVVRCATDPPVDYPLTPRDYARVDNGFLVAYNDGEWGGGLVHYDAAGVFRQSITDENTVRVLHTPHGLFAFTGLAHQFTEYGHVLRLERTGGVWRARKIDLKGTPGAIRVEPDGSVLVATTRGLMRLVQGSRVERLHTWRWRGYPDSIEEDADGTLYIGMGLVVVRLRPKVNGYQEEWLVPWNQKERGHDAAAQDR